jgi:hypothetical protein
MMLKIGKSIETRLHPNENGGQITLPSEKFELYFFLTGSTPTIDIEPL